MNTKNQMAKTKIISIIQLICGCVIALFSFLMVTVGVTQIKDSTDVGLCIFFVITLAIGILLIALGVQRRKIIAKFLLYTSMLSQDSEKSLDTLSRVTNDPIDRITKNINKMLSYGLLHNVSIDYNKNCIVHLDRNSVEPIDDLTAPKEAPKYVIVKCPNCGGTNKIIEGTTSKCEYCGSFISSEK